MPTPFSDDESRWQAVVRRNLDADGIFVYSVKTTGVYCRPHCSARLANRENVAFHDGPEPARRAGFRPCRRCRPDDAPLLDRQRAAVTRACRLIEGAVTPPSLADLSAGIADCDPVTLPGCGHLAFATRPRQVAAEVTRFLNN